MHDASSMLRNWGLQLLQMLLPSSGTGARAAGAAVAGLPLLPATVTVLASDTS
jgi:hypothetical protein